MKKEYIIIAVLIAAFAFLALRMKDEDEKETKDEKEPPVNYNPPPRINTVSTVPVVASIPNAEAPQTADPKPLFSDEGEGKLLVEKRMLQIWNSGKVYEKVGFHPFDNFENGAAYPSALYSVISQLAGNDPTSINLRPKSIDASDTAQIKSILEKKGFLALKKDSTFNKAVSEYEILMSFETFNFNVSDLKKLLKKDNFGKANFLKLGDRKKAYDRYYKDVKQMFKNVNEKLSALDFQLKQAAIEDLNRTGWKII